VSNLTAEQFAIAQNVSRETFLRLEAYVALLTKWQAAINLVSRETLDDVWRRHIQDSAQLAALIPAAAETITDLGSGAGLPGLVLAARLTGATAIVHQDRIEAVPPFVSDVVTARALAPLDRLLTYASRFSGPETLFLFPKGARVDDELTAAAKSWTMDVTRHQSLTDDDGVILAIRSVVRGGSTGNI
jgi:16S rRNA (guanine527-N7)-methyltransferase